MSADDLADLHLADLHAKAAEAGVNGYRMLSREELIAELYSGGGRKRSRWPRRKAPDVDAESKTDELKIVEDTKAESEQRSGERPRAEACAPAWAPRRARQGRARPRAPHRR